jgi:hypothetical protein
VTAFPAPSLRHLSRLTDERGIAEHARFVRPRHDLSYCTDDAGRLLAVACRLSADRQSRRLATVAVAFLARAQDSEGRFRLRLGGDGRWTDDPPSEDAAGRALLGLGIAAADAPWPDVRDGARVLFDRAGGFRSAYPRATAYAALGAVAVLAATPNNTTARHLVEDAAASLPRPVADPVWPWPEPRLTYGNAVLADALLAVGRATGDSPTWRQGLALLAWLVDTETVGSWFSFTPVGGRGPGDPKPGFDQQPIEAWAMADACARAYALTRDPRWAGEVERAAAWFAGANDVGVAMFDPATDGGFDGLEPGGVNHNQGAESTLAFAATMAQAAAVGAPGQGAPSRPAAARASSR